MEFYDLISVCVPMNETAIFTCGADTNSSLDGNCLGSTLGRTECRASSYWIHWMNVEANGAGEIKDWIQTDVPVWLEGWNGNWAYSWAAFTLAFLMALASATKSQWLNYIISLLEFHSAYVKLRICKISKSCQKATKSFKSYKTYKKLQNLPVKKLFYEFQSFYCHLWL